MVITVIRAMVIMTIVMMIIIIRGKHKVKR